VSCAGHPDGVARLRVRRRAPDPIARKATETFGIDRMAAMRTAFDSVRRAGVVSLIGVYGGEADPMPMMELFDKGITMRMGQTHVKRWIDEIMPALEDDADPLRRGPPLRSRCGSGP
jgi:threonine dehydrogenase-like Zn-dependent dehydrogenase